MDGVLSTASFTRNDSRGNYPNMTVFEVGESSWFTQYTLYVLYLYNITVCNYIHYMHIYIYIYTCAYVYAFICMYMCILTTLVSYIHIFFIIYIYTDVCVYIYMQNLGVKSFHQWPWCQVCRRQLRGIQPVGLKPLLGSLDVENIGGIYSKQRDFIGFNGDFNLNSEIGGIKPTWWGYDGVKMIDTTSKMLCKCFWKCPNGCQ